MAPNNRIDPAQAESLVRRAHRAGSKRPFGKDAPRKRWQATLPYFTVRWLVGQHHVGDSYEVVVTALLRRLASQHVDLPQAAIRELARYACAVHFDNRVLYAYVMGGR